MQRHTVPNECMNTPSNPSVAEPMDHHRGMKTWEITWFYATLKRLAFSMFASKPSSFLESVRAIAAILRAKVSRAISGFMPFSSKAT